jgi:P-type Cu+ transporter
MVAMAVSISTVLANSFGGKLRAVAPGAARKDAPPEVQADSEHVFSVPGIHCSGCAENIRLYLQEGDGVRAVSGNIGDRTVTVAYDAQQTDLRKLAGLVKDLGYSIDRAA